MRLTTESATTKTNDDAVPDAETPATSKGGDTEAKTDRKQNHQNMSFQESTIIENIDCVEAGIIPTFIEPGSGSAPSSALVDPVGTHQQRTPFTSLLLLSSGIR